MTTAPDSIPRFNHVAFSVPRELVQEKSRNDLLSFYGEVFGWSEMPTMTRDGELFVLRVHSNEQFVYLHASETPLTCPPGDHFGLSVSTPQELDACVERARKYQERDDRVEISERLDQDFKVVRLHSVYLRYLLPMRIELQCYEWAKGANAQSVPSQQRSGAR